MAVKRRTGVVGLAPRRPVCIIRQRKKGGLLHSGVPSFLPSFLPRAASGRTGAGVRWLDGRGPPLHIGPRPSARPRCEPRAREVGASGAPPAIHPGGQRTVGKIRCKSGPAPLMSVNRTFFFRRVKNATINRFSLKKITLFDVNGEPTHEAIKHYTSGPSFESAAVRETLVPASHPPARRTRQRFAQPR